MARMGPVAVIKGLGLDCWLTSSPDRHRTLRQTFWKLRECFLQATEPSLDSWIVERRARERQPVGLMM